MTILNPWVLLGVVLALVGAFFYGVHVEHGRFMGFVAEVKINGEVAARESARRQAQQDLIKKQGDERHVKDKEATASQLAVLQRRLRDARAASSIVPAAAPAASGCAGSEAGSAYWKRLREGVDATLARLEAGAVGRIREGGEAIDAFNTCAAQWMEQWRSSQ